MGSLGSPADRSFGRRILGDRHGAALLPRRIASIGWIRRRHAAQRQSRGVHDGLHAGRHQKAQGTGKRARSPAPRRTRARATNRTHERSRHAQHAGGLAAREFRRPDHQRESRGRSRARREIPRLPPLQRSPRRRIAPDRTRGRMPGARPHVSPRGSRIPDALARIAPARRDHFPDPEQRQRNHRRDLPVERPDRTRRAAKADSHEGKSGRPRRAFRGHRARIQKRPGDDFRLRANDPQRGAARHRFARARRTDPPADAIPDPCGHGISEIRAPAGTGRRTGIASAR